MAFEKLPNEVLIEILDKMTYDEVLDIHRKRIDKRITDLSATVIRRRNRLYSSISRQRFALIVLLQKFNERDAMKIINAILQRFRFFGSAEDHMDGTSMFRLVYALLEEKLVQTDPLLTQIRENSVYVETAFIIIRFDFLLTLFMGNRRDMQYYIEHFYYGRIQRFTKPENEFLEDIVDGEKLWKKMIIPGKSMFPPAPKHWYLTQV